MEDQERPKQASRETSPDSTAAAAEQKKKVLELERALVARAAEMAKQAKGKIIKFETVFTGQAFDKLIKETGGEELWAREFMKRTMGKSIIYEYSTDASGIRRREPPGEREGKSEGASLLPAEAGVAAAKSQKKGIAENQRQLEYYFGPDNYPRDKYLHGLEGPGKYVPLDTILAFKKIQVSRDKWFQMLIAGGLSSVKGISVTPNGKGLCTSDGSISNTSFVAYQKISQSSDGRALRSIAAQSLDKAEWVATEKVHGANFSFYCNGDGVKWAKRKSMISPADRFVRGYEPVVEAHLDCVKKLFQLLKKTNSGLSLVIVYGELFGGSYPHPEVKANNGVSRVQKGVFYAPGLHFMCFDVAVCTATGRRYLDYDEMTHSLKEGGFPLVAKPIQRGPLEQLLSFDVEAFTSTVPYMLGLPEIKGNIAEGLVLRLAKEADWGERPILKLKSKRFKENAAAPSLREKKSKKKERESLGEAADRLLAELECGVTENRLRSVTSKILGEVTHKKHIARVANLLAEDVTEDFLQADPPKPDMKSNKDRLDALDKPVREKIETFLQKTARGLVSRHIQAIIRQDF